MWLQMLSLHYIACASACIKYFSHNEVHSSFLFTCQSLELQAYILYVAQVSSSTKKGAKSMVLTLLWLVCSASLQRWRSPPSVCDKVQTKRLTDGWIQDPRPAPHKLNTKQKSFFRFNIWRDKIADGMAYCHECVHVQKTINTVSHTRCLLPVILGRTVFSTTADRVCLSECSSSSWPCPWQKVSTAVNQGSFSIASMPS